MDLAPNRGVKSMHPLAGSRYQCRHGPVSRRRPLAAARSAPPAARPRCALPSTNRVGVVVTPARMPQRKSRCHALLDLVRAAVALEALEVEAELLGAAPTGAGRPGGPGRRTASRASPRSGPAAPRPRRPGPARGPAGASTAPGSGGTRAAPAHPLEQAVGLRAVRALVVAVLDHERGALAAHVVVRAGRRRAAAAEVPARREAGRGLERVEDEVGARDLERRSADCRTTSPCPRDRSSRAPAATCRTGRRRRRRPGDLALRLEVGEQRDREVEPVLERLVAEGGVDRDAVELRARSSKSLEQLLVDESWSVQTGLKSSG